MYLFPCRKWQLLSDFWLYIQKQLPVGFCFLLSHTLSTDFTLPHSYYHVAISDLICSGVISYCFTVQWLTGWDHLCDDSRSISILNYPLPSVTSSCSQICVMASSHSLHDTWLAEMIRVNNSWRKKQPDEKKIRQMQKLKKPTAPNKVEKKSAWLKDCILQIYLLVALPSSAVRNFPSVQGTLLWKTVL